MSKIQVNKIQVSKIREVRFRVRQVSPKALLIFFMMSFATSFVADSVVASVTAIAPVANATATPASLGETLLEFQTRQYAVRIFRQRGILRLNLHNRQTAQVEQRNVPMRQTVTDTGIIYTNLQGETVYTVTVAPDGSAYDLKIQQDDRPIYSDRVQSDRVQSDRVQSDQIQSDRVATTETPTQATRSTNSNPPSNRAVALQPVLDSETIARFETSKYAVRIYSRNDELRMNLYNRRTDKVELKAVPVKSTHSSSSTTYSYLSRNLVYAATVMPIGGYHLVVTQGDRVIYNEQGY